MRPGLIVAGVVFVLDQLVKWVVTGPLGISQLGDVREIVSIFALRFVPNIGVSLGLLRADGDATRWALVALTGAIAGGVVWWMTRERNRQDLVALGLILGGALGNILDRVRFGYVVDFADLHFGEFRPFLVFNVADAAITVGVLVLLIRALLVRERPVPVGENVMRTFVVLAAGLSCVALLSGCGKRGYDRQRPDEFAVARQAPLVIPPDFALVPPAPGAAPTQGQNAQEQALDALFGGSAPRSTSETAALRSAGAAGADTGIRSDVGDPGTNVVDKGTTTRDIVAAPQGDGAETRSATGPAPTPTATPK